MGFYKNVKCVKSCEVQTKNNIFPKRKLHIFSLFFICSLSFSMLGLSVDSLGLKREVQNITSSWSPNITDLGKLKFVINQSEDEEDVFSEALSMSMPFENTYVSAGESDSFIVNGLGGLIVKSCMAGKVIKVEDGEQKTIHISHGKGLVSIYGNIDTLGVKEGDKVEKNTPLGVSLNSIINLKILFKNKMLTGLTVIDGVLTFI